MRYEFMKSPLMSTYLIYWTYGRFEYLERCSEAGVGIRVYTPPGRLSEAEFALKLATQCLDFYSKYFDIPYPLKKLDFIALHRRNNH